MKKSLLFALTMVMVVGIQSCNKERRTAKQIAGRWDIMEVIHNGKDVTGEDNAYEVMEFDAFHIKRIKSRRSHDQWKMCFAERKNFSRDLFEYQIKEPNELLRLKDASIADSPLMPPITDYIEVIELSHVDAHIRMHVNNGNDVYEMRMHKDKRTQ